MVHDKLIKRVATMELSKGNIGDVIEEYIGQVRSLLAQFETSNVYRLLVDLKRKPLGSGPYPDVSLFEAANRILSDLVILFGVRHLLSSATLCGEGLPFTEYAVKLGTASGTDVEATAEGFTLGAEAFNVSRSFFQTKRREALSRLRQGTWTHRLVMFNDDAVGDPHRYPRKTKENICLVTVHLPL